MRLENSVFAFAFGSMTLLIVSILGWAIGTGAGPEAIVPRWIFVWPFIAPFAFLFGNTLFLAPGADGFRYPAPLSGAMRRHNWKLRIGRRIEACDKKAKACDEERVWWEDEGDEMRRSVLDAERESALREKRMLEKRLDQIKTSEFREDKERRYLKLTNGDRS